MDYYLLSNDELKNRLNKANIKLETLKTQGGLWATEMEINICVQILKMRDAL